MMLSSGAVAASAGLQAADPSASTLDAGQTAVRRSTRSSARAASEPPSGLLGDNGSQEANRRAAPDPPAAATGHAVHPHPLNNPHRPNNPHPQANRDNAAARGSGVKKKIKKAKKAPPQRRPNVPQPASVAGQAPGPPPPPPPMPAQLQTQMQAQIYAQQQMLVQAQMQAQNQARMPAQMQAQLQAAGPSAPRSTPAAGPPPPPREYTIQDTARLLSQQTGILEIVALHALQATVRFKALGVDRWLEEAQVFVAMHNEEEEEKEQLRQSMATSLLESEAAKAAAAAAAPSHPEELADEYRSSAILASLSACVCINLLLGPSCSLCKPLISLLSWEKKCGRWYKGPGTKAYFDSLALECCACLHAHIGFPSRTASPAPLAAACTSGGALPYVLSSVTSAGAAAAAREAAGTAVAAAGSSYSSHQGNSLHLPHAACSSLAEAVQAPMPQLIRCCLGGCGVCASPLTAGPPALHLSSATAAQTASTPAGVTSPTPLRHQLSLLPPHLARLAYSEPATTTTAAHQHTGLTSTSAAPAAAAQPHLQTPTAQQVSAAVSALAELCTARVAQIQKDVCDMPQTANAVPAMFRQDLKAMPAASNADSDVVCMDESDGEVQGRNWAMVGGNTQSGPQSAPARRLGRPVTFMEVD